MKAQGVAERTPIFTDREKVLLSCLILLKVGINFYFNAVSGFHRDEYLYLAFGDHPAWGYFSVPPFIGVISFLVEMASNGSNFWARFLPAIAGGLSVFIIALIVKEAGGKLFALAMACMAFIFSPIYLRVNSLLQPVSFDVLFWLLSMFLILRMLRTKDTRLWYPVFITWGVGFLNKYLIAILIIATLGALLLSRDRKLLFTRSFLIGGLVSLLMILPNLLWQYNHNFPVFHHLRELNDTQLVNVRPADFLIDQLVFNMPFILPLLFGLAAMLFFRPLSHLKPLASIYFIILAILLVTHGKNYYTIGYYPVLFGVCASIAERFFSDGWKFLRYIVLPLVFLLNLPFIPVLAMPFMSYEKIAAYTRALPVFEAGTRWEDGQLHEVPQDFADMTGWKELFTIVDDEYSRLSADEKKKTVVYAENYGQAGSIKYYGKSRGIPEPVSFSDNFLLWAPDNLDGITAVIYVNFDDGDTRKLFMDVTQAGEVRSPYFRENGLKVFVCRDPVPEFYSVYREKAARLKNDFIK